MRGLVIIGTGFKLELPPSLASVYIYLTLYAVDIHYALTLYMHTAEARSRERDSYPLCALLVMTWQRYNATPSSSS